MRFEWMKKIDNQGNPTYIRDEVGLLVVRELPPQNV